MIWPLDVQHHDIGTEFKYKLTDISRQWTWAILIVHGGKFAGAVYRGNTMILHKTLSRYVVRKKQGKRQANHLSVQISIILHCHFPQRVPHRILYH